MSGKPTVYMATNVVNGKIYIGATSVGFDKRKQRHLSRARLDRGCPRLYDAIKKYGADSFDWRVVREFNSTACAFTFERIAIFLRRPAYNVTTGGGGTRGITAWNRRRVICLEDGIVYQSMADAGNAYGSSSAEISEACSGKQKTVRGRHFIIYGGQLNADERQSIIRRMDEIAVKRRRRRDLLGLRLSSNTVSDGRDALGRSAAGPMKSARSVRCLNDNRVFPSASSAASAYEVSRSAVIELCLGKNGRKTVGGYRFVYEESP